VQGCADGVVRIWNMLCGKLVANLKGHEGPILAVAISPDGRYAATAATDTTALLWDLTALR
jgi:WD40 repeat protein